ncbi:MAG: PASTA domain-containing protein [Actinobacteria bacterium]|nr:PASTA domain-containing protein [Actinomycetota bacterium]
MTARPSRSSGRIRRSAGAGLAIALLAASFAAAPEVSAQDRSGIETVSLSSPRCPDTVERVEPTGSTHVTNTIVSTQEFTDAVSSGLVDRLGGDEAARLVVGEAVSAAVTRYRQAHENTGNTLSMETVDMAEFTELVVGELVAMHALPSSALPSSALPSSARPASALPEGITIEEVRTEVQGAVVESVFEALPSSGFPAGQVDLFTNQLLGNVLSALPSSGFPAAERIVSSVVAAHTVDGALPSSAMPALVAELQTRLDALPASALPSSALPSSFAVDCVNASAALPSSLAFDFSQEMGALPSSALPSSALPSSALPSSALPSSALPSSALPSSITQTDATSEAMGKAFFDPANALPSSALPSSALPSSAVPWADLMTEIGSGFARALPSSALPSSALPSSALPSSALPSSALPSSALPSSALPSSIYSRALFQSLANLNQRNALPSSALPSSALPSSALPSSALPSSALPSSALPSSAVTELVEPLANEMRAVLAEWGADASALPSSAAITELIYGAAFRALPSSLSLEEALPSSMTAEMPEILSAGIADSMAMRGLGVEPSEILGALPSSLVLEPVADIPSVVFGRADLAAAAARPALGGMFDDQSAILPSDLAQVARTGFQQGMAVVALGSGLSFAAADLTEPCVLTTRHTGEVGASTSFTVGAMVGTPDPWDVIEGDLTVFDRWRGEDMGWEIDVNDCGYTMTHPDRAAYDVQIHIPDDAVDGYLAGLSSPAQVQVLRCNGYDTEFSEHSYSWYDPSTGNRGGGVFVPSEWTSGTKIFVPVLAGSRTITGGVTVPPWIPEALRVEEPEIPSALDDQYRSLVEAWADEPCQVPGTDLYEVPNLRGKTEEQAIDAIEHCGFLALGGSTEVEEDDPLVALVAGQTPEAGEQKPKGSFVTYLIGMPRSGPTTSPPETSTPGTSPTTTSGTITFKDYKNTACAWARADIINEGLNVGACQFAWYATIESGLIGKVDSQEPAAGTHLAPGTTVELWQWEAATSEHQCGQIPGYWWDNGCHSNPEP